MIPTHEAIEQAFPHLVGQRFLIDTKTQDIWLCEIVDGEPRCLSRLGPLPSLESEHGTKHQPGERTDLCIKCRVFKLNNSGHSQDAKQE